MKPAAILLALALILTASPAAFAQHRHQCSTKQLAGRWMFDTEVGRQQLFGAGGDITAIGIMTIDGTGRVTGRFDATVEELAFLPDVTFEGSVTVNDDCTGTLEFVTSAGSSRTDSIVVISPWSVKGMSRDILNLWTYDMRRL